eukprot:6185190-Pleurochrysis_carterae.AAC.2
MPEFCATCLDAFPVSLLTQPSLAYTSGGNDADGRVVAMPAVAPEFMLASTGEQHSVALRA